MLLTEAQRGTDSWWVAALGVTLGGEQAPCPSASALRCLSYRLETGPLFVKGRAGSWESGFGCPRVVCVYTLPRCLPQGPAPLHLSPFSPPDRDRCRTAPAAGWGTGPSRPLRPTWCIGERSQQPRTDWMVRREPDRVGPGTCLSIGAWHVFLLGIYIKHPVHQYLPKKSQG